MFLTQTYGNVMPLWVIKLLNPLAFASANPTSRGVKTTGSICGSVGKSAKSPAGSGSDPADAGQSIRSVRSLRN